MSPSPLSKGRAMPAWRIVSSTPMLSNVPTGAMNYSRPQHFSKRLLNCLRPVATMVPRSGSSNLSWLTTAVRSVRTRLTSCFSLVADVRRVKTALGATAARISQLQTPPTSQPRPNPEDSQAA